jgi:hypothetical protein
MSTDAIDDPVELTYPVGQVMDQVRERRESQKTRAREIEPTTSTQGTGISSLLWENPSTTAYAPVLVQPLSVEAMPIIIIPGPQT